MGFFSRHTAKAKQDNAPPPSASASKPPVPPVKTAAVSTDNPKMASASTTDGEPKTYTLVLMRHGESEWNKLNLFTGWTDVTLTEHGIAEAQAGADELKKEGFTFDVAYTSLLKRAIHTLWNVLTTLELQWIPVIRDWRLNERHYGALQGLNKAETTAKHGEDQVYIWRRSYDVPPPALELDDERHPSFDRRYASLDKTELPATECLKDCVKRVLVSWENVIVPDIKAGKRILIAAHGNSLRALVKHLDEISEADIPTLNIPTGVPLVYVLDENMKPIKQEGAIAPLSGRYLGDPEEIAKRIGDVANQAKAAK